jgi:hypothetical protein
MVFKATGLDCRWVVLCAELYFASSFFAGNEIRGDHESVKKKGGIAQKKRGEDTDYCFSPL